MEILRINLILEKIPNITIENNYYSNVHNYIVSIIYYFIKYIFSKLKIRNNGLKIKYDELKFKYDSKKWVGGIMNPLVHGMIAGFSTRH